DHQEAFNVWRLVKSLPDSQIFLGQVENLTQRLRKRRPDPIPLLEPVATQSLPLRGKPEGRKVLPLDAGSSGSAKVAKLRFNPPPASAVRDELVREVHEFYATLGSGGSRWIESVCVDTSFRFVARAVESFDDAALKRHISSLVKFRDFVRDHDSDANFLQPELKVVIAFLQDGDARGNTVSRGYYYNLLWWQSHLGMPFHTDHSAAEVFTSHRAGHVSSQAEVLAIPIVIRLLELATGFCDSKSEGAISQIVRMALVFLASSTRHKHFRISVFLGADERFLHFKCLKGKRRIKGTRPGFEWSVARFLVAGKDILGGLIPLFEALRASNPDASIPPMPDPHVRKDCPLTNDATFSPRPMSFNKFTRLLQGLLQMTGGCGFHPDGITTYAFRRFCITIANSCRFHPEDEAAIGNWVETISVKDGSSTRRTCFSTRTHYAGAKTQAAADVRLITFLATAEACRVIGHNSITHADVSCVANSIQDLWEVAVSSTRIGKSSITPVSEGDFPTHVLAAPKNNVPEGSESSEESEEILDQSSKDPVPLPMEEPFFWFKQRSSIHVSESAGLFVTICTGKTFIRQPVDSGDTFASAREVAGSWCPECLKKLPLSAQERLLKDV
ncbi:MAG: hypothetical protein NZ605_12135, partial [Acidimicrobiales bacterium]|nr:hypothetical protein [Acidimicrobiales bacterium]